MNWIDDRTAGEYPAGKDMDLAETRSIEYSSMSQLDGYKLRANPACS